MTKFQLTHVHDTGNIGYAKSDTNAITIASNGQPLNLYKHASATVLDIAADRRNRMVTATLDIVDSSTEMLLVSGKYTRS